MEATHHTWRRGEGHPRLMISAQKDLETMPLLYSPVPTGLTLWTKARSGMPDCAALPKRWPVMTLV
jgi:hypothetical protein